MKRIIWSCVALALGVLFVVAATFALLDDKVSCGGKTMSEGDVCVRENRSGTVVAEDDINDTRTSEKVGTFIGIGFGVLIVVIGFQNLRIGLRNRKTAASQHQGNTAAPWPPQPQPNPQGPQQQQAHQQGWQHQPQPQQPSAQQYPHPDQHSWQQHGTQPQPDQQNWQHGTQQPHPDQQNWQQQPQQHGSQQ
ncbi:hypothetical protein [Kibdelosporangium phytohabitans]|uniref:Uncharacterized protein n=1 Tax=Kibdelosporangium phytohabitans TaxID=860235 RepID=A0A0N9I182_9PSEU|nr:hypothetical protein [Kibdelosporangium phytohabitans]ALG11324.1 hypothetical protein AOZ06_34590 [Kibdelosporangium phytohabitans]MBE1462629.1 hypothetical protein [Kibdelosporangium phytohabitans]